MKITLWIIKKQGYCWGSKLSYRDDRYLLRAKFTNFFVPESCARERCDRNWAPQTRT